MNFNRNQEYGKGFSKRAAGIEPALIAWKAIVLPLNYARKFPTY